MLELSARIRVHLKKDTLSILKYDDLEMDVSNYIMKKNDVILSLSRTEFDLLKLFLLNKETLIKRERIINDIWGWNASSNLLDVTIKNLRQKLGREYIQTIRGIGYSLKKG